MALFQMRICASDQFCCSYLVFYNTIFVFIFQSQDFVDLLWFASLSVCPSFFFQCWWFRL